MFCNVGSCYGWPRDKVVILDGVEPGGGNRRKTGGMQKSHMIFDAMADAFHIVCVMLIFEGG